MTLPAAVIPLTGLAPNGAKKFPCALVAINISLPWSESARTVHLKLAFTNDKGEMENSRLAVSLAPTTLPTPCEQSLAPAYPRVHTYVNRRSLVAPELSSAAG